MRFTPGEIATSATERDVARVVNRARREGATLRVVGAGHSSSPLVETSELLASSHRLAGLIDHDTDRCEATVQAGTTLQQAGRELLLVGLAFENLGDIDKQTVAGAIGTGTHGTGKRIGNLATRVVGVRMVTASGEIAEWTAPRDERLLRAARVSLGALGFVTELRLSLLPAYRLHRREWCLTAEACLAQLDEFIESHRHLDFYWYPRRDDVKVRALDMTDRGPDEIEPEPAVRQTTGWSSDVIANARELRFHEMEYALPAVAGPECFREVRRRMIERHRKHVAWRVLYRTVAADDAYLSPAYGRDTVTISVHQNASLPYLEYFGDIEPIFRSFGGRPHWAKVHGLRGGDLLELYPEAGSFLRIREELDPQGLFVNPYLQGLLGLPAPAGART